MDAFFCLACSLREESLNEKLLDVVVRRLSDRPNTEARAAKLTEFPMPLYNADIQTRDGIPESAHRLREAIEAAGNLVVATPEYNHSIAGPLKNAIDWVSRFRPNPFSDTHVLLMAAAPSRIGGLRGLEHTRVPLQALGAHVYPRMYGLGEARGAFDQHGRLVDEQRLQEVRELVDGFVDHVRCCRAGEHAGR